jgi:predicted small secreted protein
MQTRSKFETRRAVVAFLLLACTATLVAGCKTLAGARHTGVIIARRAQVRSSTAIVAADIKEVLRGEVVDIVETDNNAENGERWLRVRTHDAESTEGWIEARNVMPQELLERSLRLAEEDKDIPAQSTGQLRASANLRFSPDRSNNENILLKMEGGSHFEIVGWKRVPKPKAAETSESDDAPKAGSAPTNNNRRRGESEAAKTPEEMNELWYKVRLTPDISPAPAGWVFGKQVELSVPSDIVFYRAGREFVAWHRLDEADKGNSTAAQGGAGEVKESQPGSWVILERSDSDEPSNLDDPDFDRIYVLGYDKTRQEHYTAYRSHDLRGHLPLRVEGSGDGKSFVVRLEDGKEVKDYRFRVYKDDHGHLRSEPQQELPVSPKKK